MRKIRILVVDDSTVIRRLLSETLAQDETIEIAGTAANGLIALAKLPQVNPDLVTLDIEMPDMDGLATLRELRKTYPRLPVIMFSTLTAKGATATLDALSAGATDYVTKPANVGSVMAAMASVREQLIPRIHALCGGGPPRTVVAPRPLTVAPAATAQRRSSSPIKLLAIGVSTGGPNALHDLFGRLPGNLPVPVVIVQHMPPVFTKHLAERLNAKSSLAIHEAAPGDVLQPGGVWLAPGNYHMTLARNGNRVEVHTNQEPPENSCRPAVDVLFRSAAQLYGGDVLGVVMTGMGQDGLRGCEWIRQAGGRVLVQDAASSVVWGMPGAVADAGLADGIFSLDRLPQEIVREVARGRVAPTLPSTGR